MKSVSQAEEDVLRTIREFRDLKATINKLQTETETIDRLIYNLNQGHAPNEQDLKLLGLVPQPQTVLKLRLIGLQKTRKATLSEQLSKLRDRKELLEDLLICPVCKGQGIISKRVYDRSNGRITTLAKIEPCIKCGGTGKNDLSDYIKDLVSSLQLN